MRKLISILLHPSYEADFTAPLLSSLALPFIYIPMCVRV